MGRRLLSLVLCTSCSYFAVHGPGGEKDPPCTESAFLPSADGVIGTFAVAGAIAGEVVDHKSSHPIDHFELLIGLPVLIAGFTFLFSANHGTDKVEECRASKPPPPPAE